MFKLYFTIIFSMLLGSVWAQHTTQTQTQGISFIENKNQWEKDIQFRADLPSGFLFVYNNALQYSFYDGKALAYHKHKELYKNNPEYALYEKQKDIKAHSFVVEFLGARPVQVQSKKATTTNYHYYVGGKNKWASNVKGYQEIIYPDVYQGISYHLFRTEHSLKYEFRLEKGADPRQIQLQYNYAENIAILPDGSLEITTSVGKIHEKKPLSFQIIHGKKVEVKSRFVLKNNILSFDFPKGYNKNYPLVIDPELVFSTYSGGSSDNWGNTATFDASENLYSGATLFGLSFPNFTGATTIGSPNSSFGGLTDVGIFKYNTTGTTLLQLTFIGGTDSEIPHSLVVDNQNRLLIFGTTSSTNFPTTTGQAFQGGTSISVVGISYLNGSDLFMMKLNSDGTLNSSRLLGGTGNDGLKPSGGTTIHNYGDELRGDIYVDETDNVYVASTTRSTSITGITGSLSGTADGLVIKMDSNLGVLWGQYFGGTGIDLALSIKTNAAGEVYVGGGTTSNNLPATIGSLNTFALGNDDGFITKFSSAGTLMATTYLGTSAADMAFFIDLDSEQEVYAFGQTFGNYPISTNVYNNPNSGQFIHKISPDLTTSRWSTRVGGGDGNPDISPTAFLVVTESNCNNIYIAGWGGTSLNGAGSDVRNMPTTPDAYRRTTVNGRDFYIAVYKRNMERLLYGTFFGENASNEVGDHVDGGTSRFAKNGIIYHSTCASCGATNGFPTTSGAWSASNNSTNCNNAVFKFKLNISADFDMLNPNNLQIINSGTETCEKRLLFKFTALDSDEFLWEILDVANNVIFSQNTEKDFYYTFTASGNYKIRLSVVNCNQTAQALQDITIVIPNFQTNDSVAICRGESIQLQASGANSYQWTPTTGLNNPNIANPIASPTQTTTYTITFINDKCRRDQTVKVKVLPVLTADFDFKLLKDCNTPYRVQLSLPTSLDTTKFVRFTWNMGDGTILEGTKFGEYVYAEPNKDYVITLTALNPNGCNTIVKKTVKIPAPPINPPNAITPNNDGLNDTFEVAEAGSKLEVWNRWGKRIFKSDNYKNDWGKDVPNGTYYYLLISPSGITCNGWVEVLK